MADSLSWNGEPLSRWLPKFFAWVQRDLADNKKRFAQNERKIAQNERKIAQNQQRIELLEGRQQFAEETLRRVVDLIEEERRSRRALVEATRKSFVDIRASLARIERKLG